MHAAFEPLIDADQAGQALGIHPKTVQRMAREGKLPALRIGKYWRFRLSQLDLWLKSTLNSGPALCVPPKKEEKH
jgi:excisionase family DNA binding protein